MTLRRLTILLLLLSLLAFGASACGKTKQPPIVLIVIDTLRADHVGSYGYERPTTPALDAFAKQGVRFTHTYAPASWTVPSMNSMFTGVYPPRHGVVFAEIENVTVSSQQTMSKKFTTLAESLQAAGYATFGISANYHMHEQYGMDQGFDHYKTFWFADREAVDKQLEIFLPQIQRLHKQGKPYFLFVHYFDPHHPYKINKGFTERMAPELDLELVEKYSSTKFVDWAQTGVFFKEPDKMQMLVDLYDGEVAACDDSLAKLLKSLPGYEQAAVVVTSDHGEAFGEHHNMIHGRDLYAETVDVPLAIKLPGGKQAGLTVDTPVSLIDLYPTLATLAGAQRPKYLDGLDLAPLWSGKALAERMLYSFTERVRTNSWAALIGPQFKLMHSIAENKYFLFDRLTDATETENVYEQHGDLALEYRRLLAEKRGQEPLYKPGVTGEPMSDQLRSTLRDLGYL